MARTATFRSRHSKRAALSILRGRPKRRREPTAAEIERERCFLYEVAEFMEAGVFDDRCELVPEEVEDVYQAHVAQELW
jgi:hypothetical protein